MESRLSSLDQPVFTLEAIPQRRLRQRLQQIDRQQRNPGFVDKGEQRLAGLGLVGIQPHDDAGNDLHAVAVDGANAFQNRDHHVVVLLHRLQRIGIGRFDAAEDRDEERLAHLLQNLRALGDVERRLAGEPHDVTGLLLPLDQMRQQVERRLSVADEIVVDEIHRASHPALEQFVELGDDLLRRLEPRIAAVQSGDVAEFALIWATARILDRTEEIFPDLGKLVGRNRKVGHGDAIGGLQDHLLRRARGIARQTRDQLVRGIAEFPDMQIVERGIVIRTGADRRSADRNRQIKCMRAAADIVHLLALDVHAADQHGFRPLEILRRSAADILVDKADRPVGGQIGRDQQQPLRRHEGLDTVGQRIGIFEGAERRRVARKDAQDAPHRFNALSSHRTTSRRRRNLSTPRKAGP